MKVTVSPKRERGGIAALTAVPSKSACHRLLMLAALSKKETPTHITCAGTNDDIERTADCLAALGAKITRTESGFSVLPIDRTKEEKRVCTLNVGESGSTLRFLLPILGALSVDADIVRAGRLPKRPLAPLDEVLTSHGMQIRQDEENEAVLHVRGGLDVGAPLSICGGVSSQNVSGLLMALACADGEATLHVEGELSSAPYVDMTLDALRLSGVIYTVETAENGRVYHKPRASLCPPDAVFVEDDWSSAAPILCAGALWGGVRLSGLDNHSRQGDRAILSLLSDMGAVTEVDKDTVTVMPPIDGKLKPVTVSAEHMPDLVPTLAVTLGAAYGESVIRDCARLRIKESDRLAATEALLGALGVAAYIDGDDLHIYGICRDIKNWRPDRSAPVRTVPPVSDHRMVMAATLGALYTNGNVEIACAESIDKSYPRFFADMRAFCDITEGSEEGSVCQAPTEKA